jgi:cell wall-associated NlpC family hydrolase
MCSNPNNNFKIAFLRGNLDSSVFWATLGFDHRSRQLLHLKTEGMIQTAMVVSLSFSLLLSGLSRPSILPASSHPEQEHPQDLYSFFHPSSSAAQPEPALPTFKDSRVAKIDSLLSYAQKLIGQPYVYGDTGEKGFDCSGFTTHVFSKFGITLSRSSTGQATDGQFVPRNEARKGDLIIFTGTNPAIRTPGHVGIILSDPGETISFVHSSSVGGVKISEVETTRYEDRFLQVRRVLD